MIAPDDPEQPGDRWHLSVLPTLLRSYPTGQARRTEKGRPYISVDNVKTKEENVF